MTEPLPPVMLPSVHVRHGHFRLESGHHSDVWLDLEALCLRPRLIQPLAAALAEKLRPYAPDIVCGPLNEGAFVSLMVASALGCEFAYAERFANAAGDALFPVEYRVPVTLRPAVHGKRVAIVNDVTSAGSAVRGTFLDLQSLGCEVVVIGSLLILGPAIREFGRERGVAIEALQELPHNQWTPAECPLCERGAPLDRSA
jgi:orotate phosphoribosyltransferase